MRVLYVTEGFPYPLTSGNLRHYHLIRGLSARHDIHLLSTVGSDTRPAHVEEMRTYCSAVETFRSTARSSILRKASAQARDLVLGRGEAAAARALAEAARVGLAGAEHHAVVLNGRMTATVLEEVGNIPVIVDLCDAVALRLRGQLEYESAPRRAAVRLRLRRVLDAETRLIAAGSHILFASRRDLEAGMANARRAVPASILPNGVDTDYWRRTSWALGTEVVLSGAMHYPPNDDAARYLAGAIMPIVWKSRPSTRLRVIGLNPSRALRQIAAREPRILVTGYVDDVRPHLELGAVYVAPLRFASGIQNKLLEAMAMEIPIVTSAVAADGLKADDLEALPLLTADSTEGFASAIVRNLERAERDPSPFATARDFVTGRFAWSDSVAVVERILADVTSAT